MGFPDTVVKRAVKVKSALTPRLKDGKLKNTNISLSWIQPTLKSVVENEKGLQKNNHTLNSGLRAEVQKLWH